MIPLLHKLKKIFKKEELKIEEDSGKMKKCSRCKKSFLFSDLHNILQGNNVVVSLCNDCLNAYFGKGSLPLDEEEGEE